MSDFTEAFVGWSNARQDAATPQHMSYIVGRATDTDLPSACAALAPLIANGALSQDAALRSVVELATPDELATLGTFPGVTAQLHVIQEG